MNPHVQRAIAVARGEIGVRETIVNGHGSNRGRRVDEYQNADFLPGVGYSWCCSFFGWDLLTALGQSLCDQVWLRSASCDSVLDWGRRHNIVSSTPEPGCAGLVMASKNDATHIFMPVEVFSSSLRSVEGNAQPLNANVLTPKGWAEMGSLSVGDAVIDPCGSESQVVGIYPQGEQDVYRLTLSDGTAVECTWDHLWNVRFTGEKNYGVVNTERVAREVMAGHSPQLPPLLPPDLGDGSDVPIPSYVLGLLIGDGGLNRPGAVRFTTKDTEMLDAIQEAYPDCQIMPITGTCDYRITMSEVIPNPDYSPVRGAYGRLISGSRPRTKKTHPLRDELEKLGLRCTSEHKCVPSSYLWTSAANRLALLQGLLDTDGHADTHGRIEFSTVSRGLAEDVLFLVQSLGGKARIQTKEINWYTSPTQLTPKRAKTAYRLAIRLPEGVKAFRLARKQERVDLRAKPNRGLPRYIKTIELVRRELCQCIKVSAPSSMYVTDGFTPTHNTNLSGAREGIGVFERTRAFSSRYLYLIWSRLLPRGIALPQTFHLIAPKAKPASPFTGAPLWTLWSGDQKRAVLPSVQGRTYIEAWRWAAWAKGERAEPDLKWNMAAQTVSINGREIPAQPILVSGRAWLPIRTLAEQFGRTVEFDNTTHKVALH